MENITTTTKSRYFIYLSYNGKNFSGWQTQPNAITVQEVLERCLSVILRAKTPVVGAGRTDSGVHARVMVAHFDTHVPYAFVTQQLAFKLNCMLPKDIAIQRIVPVCENAHARFDALWREYKYYVTFVKDPFSYEYKWFSSQPLDVDAMNSGAKILLDYSDFTSFSKLHTDVKTNICRLMHAAWSRDGAHSWVFTIRADRFLRNMVRAVVGTLVEMGRGKLKEEGLRAIVESKNRSMAGASMPGHALFLEDIGYPSELFGVKLE